MKITASIIVCTVAAAFTATTLLVDPDPVRHNPPAPSSATAAGAPVIQIQQFSFSSVTAAPGATVAVTNADGVEHTVSAVDGAFDSGLVDAGAATSFVAPSAPGTYAFVCNIHPSMAGELVVA